MKAVLVRSGSVRGVGGGSYTWPKFPSSLQGQLMKVETVIEGDKYYKVSICEKVEIRPVTFKVTRKYAADVCQCKHYIDGCVVQLKPC